MVRTRLEDQNSAWNYILLTTFSPVHGPPTYVLPTLALPLILTSIYFYFHF